MIILKIEESEEDEPLTPFWVEPADEDGTGAAGETVDSNAPMSVDVAFPSALEPKVLVTGTMRLMGEKRRKVRGFKKQG